MKKKICILIFILLAFAITPILGYWSPSAYITYTSRGNTYSQDKNINPIPKSTEEAKAEFEQGGKSSWSSPGINLVNSNKEDRSAVAILKKNDVVYPVYTDVTAKKGYYYYYKISSSFWQLGEDTMWVRYNPY